MGQEGTVKGRPWKGGFPQGCPPKLALVAGEAADFFPSPQGGAVATQDAGLSLQGQPAWTVQAGPVCLSRAHWALPLMPPFQPAQVWKGRCRGTL